MKQMIDQLSRFPRDKSIALSADAMMRHVCYALIPGIIAHTVIFGLGILIQLLLGIVTAIVCEYIVAGLRQRRLTALDWSSGCVTAALLAAAIPSTLPWWGIVVGVSFALLLSKHAYGGMGMNIFNPAMVGFCALYLSFPALMSLYPLAYIGIDESFAFIFSQSSPDSLTGATELAGRKANSTFSGTTPALIWINIAWLSGGLYLWLRNIADWRLSITFFTVFLGLTVIFSRFHETPISILQHIELGALVFTACFIISDPTTAATGQLGRWVYTGFAAILAVIIRQYSNMPDSMAFAVLLANLAAPMIDIYTRPKYIKN